STDPESQNWKLISLGQQYEHVLVDELGINVLGKVSLEEYANLLAKSSIGISLMVSPHPSYPPFEMLASGLKTYTNTYDNKLEICDSENLHMGSGSPNDIANFLLLATNKVPYDSVYRTASMEQADFGAGLLMSEAVAKVKDIILTT
ncbi:rhamnosyltransferase WsaF family glycosyltransferase, partial [Mycobacteroides abscessus]